MSLFEGMPPGWGQNESLMKLTINQIAELAQVSKGTVSKVINGHRGISPTTRDRILKLVHQLDYHPDASARALALQRTGVLGFLIPHQASTSLSGHFWSVVLSGISQEAAHLGYNLMILTPPREGDIEGALNPVLKRRSVDGLIVGSELLDLASLNDLVLHKIPFVLLGQNPSFSHYCVDVDNTQGSRSMVRHMVEQGYRHIGALFGPAYYPYVKERLAGYRQELQAQGVSWQAVAYSEYDPQSVQANLAQLLDAHTDLDALYLGSGGDFLLETLQTFRKRGLKIPEIGLGVFDDHPYLELLTPRITAVRQPVFRAGQEAVGILQCLIQNAPPDRPLVHLATELIERESCHRSTPAK